MVLSTPIQNPTKNTPTPTPTPPTTPWALLVPAVVVTKSWIISLQGLFGYQYFYLPISGSNLTLASSNGDPVRSCQQDLMKAINTLRPRQNGRHFRDNIFSNAFY